MFADYEKLVLEDYERKKSHNMLSSGLVHTTQAKLKKECVKLCRGKINGTDEKVIKDFCEEWDITKTCLYNIDKYDVDKFKPLSNFMKRLTESTDPKNIQLLAWLIDFPDRPFDYTKRYPSPMELEAGSEVPDSDGVALGEALISSKDQTTTGVEEHNIVADKTAYGENLDTSANSIQKNPPHIQMLTQKWRFHRVVVAALLVIIGTGGYWLWHRTGPAGSCMYWSGDHYQLITCSQKIPNTPIMPLDTEKLNNFKKITLPDTITHRTKGRIWYSKINNKVEFFTAAGEHPEVFGRYLKPISDYIIDTYIQPHMTSRVK